MLSKLTKHSTEEVKLPIKSTNRMSFLPNETEWSQIEDGRGKIERKMSLEETQARNNVEMEITQRRYGFWKVALNRLVLLCRVMIFMTPLLLASDTDILEDEIIDFIHLCCVSVVLSKTVVIIIKKRTLA